MATVRALSLAAINRAGAVSVEEAIEAIDRITAAVQAKTTTWPEPEPVYEPLAGREPLPSEVKR